MRLQCQQLLVALAMSLMFIASAAAHPSRIVNAQMSIGRDGAYELNISFDLPAYVLNEQPINATDAAMSALLDGPRESLATELADARDRLRSDVILRENSSSIRQATTISFPDVDAIDRWNNASSSRRLPIIQEAKLSGRFSESTHTISVCFPEVLGDLVLTIERPGQEAWVEPISAGQYSLPLPIEIEANSQAATSVSTPPASPSRVATSAKYIHWGFTHILPHGLDHILFVLGLFLLSDKVKPLLLQVTAFTVAHTVTLALSVLGVISIPSWIVEPIIAASIAFIAIENLFTKNLTPWRPFVVFAFGLVHGMGFAGVLAEAGLPQGQLANALISFNVGVELGQLAVIAIAALAVGWFRNRTWYRSAISMPASVLIAMVAIFWTFERIFVGV